MSDHSLRPARPMLRAGAGPCRGAEACRQSGRSANGRCTVWQGNTSCPSPLMARSDPGPRPSTSDTPVYAGGAEGAARKRAWLCDGRVRPADPGVHAAADRERSPACPRRSPASLVTATLGGAVIGGVVFGALSDRLGRVRVLTWTIVLFAVFTGLCAMAQGYWDLLLYRTIAGTGLGGEFGIGMALVAEAWPAARRARASSYVGLGWQAGVLTAALVTPAVAAGDRMARDVRGGNFSGFRGVVHSIETARTGDFRSAFRASRDRVIVAATGGGRARRRGSASGWSSSARCRISATTAS